MRNFEWCLSTTELSILQWVSISHCSRILEVFGNLHFWSLIWRLSQAVDRHRWSKKVFQNKFACLVDRGGSIAEGNDTRRVNNIRQGTQCCAFLLRESFAENQTSRVCSFSLWRAGYGGVYHCSLVRRPWGGQWRSDECVYLVLTRRWWPAWWNVNWWTNYE